MLWSKQSGTDHLDDALPRRKGTPTSPLPAEIFKSHIGTRRKRPTKALGRQSQKQIRKEGRTSFKTPEEDVCRNFRDCSFESANRAASGSCDLFKTDDRGNHKSSRHRRCGDPEERLDGFLINGVKLATDEKIAFAHKCHSPPDDPNHFSRSARRTTRRLADACHQLQFVSRHQMAYPDRSVFPRKHHLSINWTTYWDAEASIFRCVTDRAIVCHPGPKVEQRTRE